MIDVHQTSCKHTELGNTLFDIYSKPNVAFVHPVPAAMSGSVVVTYMIIYGYYVKGTRR